jgi:hypothetical protein
VVSCSILIRFALSSFFTAASCLTIATSALRPIVEEQASRKLARMPGEEMPALADVLRKAGRR